MEVTDVLRDRRQQPGGLQGMLTLSIAVHAAFFGAIVFTPTGFLHRSTPATVMTISLTGGGGGPDVGGMNPLGGRPVQQETPPDEPLKREAIRPPAAKAPEMTMPVPNAKPAKAGAAVKQAPDEARGRTPTKGKEQVFGNAVADTGVRGQGFGLSTGGGQGGGSSLEITGDFCCPEYLTAMMARIRTAWAQNQGATGKTIVRFTIQRDGSISSSETFRESGFPTLDYAALRAVRSTRSLAPLPDAFPNPTLTVRLEFIYQ